MRLKDIEGSDTGDLLHRYIQIQHAINITGEFGDRALRHEQEIKKELISRGFKIDAYGRIMNLDEFKDSKEFT